MRDGQLWRARRSASPSRMGASQSQAKVADCESAASLQQRMDCFIPSFREDEPLHTPPAPASWSMRRSGCALLPESERRVVVGAAASQSFDSIEGSDVRAQRVAASACGGL